MRWTKLLKPAVNHLDEIYWGVNEDGVSGVDLILSGLLV
jgi:hypothetical protein